MGRMCYGRLSEGVDYELMKIMTRETTIPKKVEKPLNKKLSTKKVIISFPFYYFILNS